MKKRLDYIINFIAEENPLHYKKIKKNFMKMDSLFFDRAESFLEKYEKLLDQNGKNLEYAVTCYLEMVADVTYETIRFMETGQYSSKSFAEVNERVYNNPEIMEYYMHGLILSQFLWLHHYNIYDYFIKMMKREAAHINSYLEIGGGHGLYMSHSVEKIGSLSSSCTFDLVDVSAISLEMARSVICSERVNYILSDIIEYESSKKYDFISMGEVLEHVEDPVGLLNKIHSLLDDNGKFFISVPANGPTIDHIYLFRNADEIRDMLVKCGFKIEDEALFYAEDVTPEKAEKYKVALMFCGVLSKA